MFWFFQPTPPPPTPIPVHRIQGEILGVSNLYSCRTVRSQRTSKTLTSNHAMLSAILGNIKQESNFRAFVCEGGD